MNILGIIFILIGLFGFYWTIFGSATVAIFYYIFQFKFLEKKKINTNNNSKIKFEALIAAYNEEINLPKTLESLKNSLPKIKHLSNELEFSAFVGLDHCTDKTLDQVLHFQNNSELKVKHFENEGERGKWFIIKQLILNSDADWVALTDCGAVWDNELILNAYTKFRDENLICVAPSYLPDRAGFLETTYWRGEQFLRVIENLSRGSIMVHGPTVFYRRSALLEAINLLGEKHWINDDVAIPLVLRNKNENYRIHYLSDLKRTAWVYDQGVVSDVNVELKRRRRILIGNIQCAMEIIIPKFSIFNLISLTSIRLVFKLLWAYWVTFFMLGALLVIFANLSYLASWAPTGNLALSIYSIFILFGVGSIVKSNYIHRLFMAYLSGLQIHKAIKALENPKKIVWS
jgi:cellulose synthase/poly-beta-1,6-N-acetylglucosamine synthase-like glycosyltransferase